MPLPLTVSCFSKIQMVLPFWYRFTRVVPDKGPLNVCIIIIIIIIFLVQFRILDRSISHFRILGKPVPVLRWSSPVLPTWLTKIDVRCDKPATLVSQTKSTRLTFVWRPSPVYHTERPPMCTAQGRDAAHRKGSAAGNLGVKSLFFLSSVQSAASYLVIMLIVAALNNYVNCCQQINWFIDFMAWSTWHCNASCCHAF